MKTLVKELGELALAGRWDIDFHLPAEGIKQFPKELVKRVDEVADVIKAKRDPTERPEEVFQYVDIASIDVATGAVVNPQELTGDEAPSRARKVIGAFNVIVSTCRPTRGAIAVVPVALHNQIASTAFSVLRAKDGVNPFYLHYALRLSSTLEQFRKWSTGSSYPAILDDDVKKTRIPVPDGPTQDRIALKIVAALFERDKAIATLNAAWNGALDNITETLCGGILAETVLEGDNKLVSSVTDVQRILAELPHLNAGTGSNGDLLAGCSAPEEPYAEEEAY